MTFCAPNKYKAKRYTLDGITFASKKEAFRWAQLRTLEKAGEIRNLQRQVPIMLEGRDGPCLTETGQHMRLTVDFVYEDKSKGWLTVWEDAKGVKTKDYLVRKSVAAAQGVEVIEV